MFSPDLIHKFKKGKKELNPMTATVMLTATAAGDNGNNRNDDDDDDIEKKANQRF